MNLEVTLQGAKKVQATKPEKKRLENARPVLKAYEACTGDSLGKVADEAIGAILASLNGEAATGGGDAPKEQEEITAADEEEPDTDMTANPDIHLSNGLPALLKRYVDLEKEKRQINKRLKEIHVEMTDVGPKLCDQMVHANLQHIKTDGYTVYLMNRRQVGRQPEVSAEDANAALEQFGWGYLVKDQYSPAALKSKVIEIIDDDEQQLPEGFDSTFKVYEETVAAVRSA